MCELTLSIMSQTKTCLENVRFYCGMYPILMLVECHQNRLNFSGLRFNGQIKLY